MGSSIIPESRPAKIEFCEDHTAPWTTNATAIGTTTTAVTDLTTKTTAARAAFEAQRAAQNAAKSATHDYYLAVAAMATAAQDIIKQIKAKAATAGPGVYSLAEIPAPATPSPVAPPGKPSDFTAQLDENGVLTLAWKCANPAGSSGTIYQVARQLGTTGTGGGMQIIGAAGDKKFTDPTVPAGTDQVTYQVTALRSTVAGAPGLFTVRFGVAPGSGELTASVVTAPPSPKLAA